MESIGTMLGGLAPKSGSPDFLDTSIHSVTYRCISNTMHYNLENSGLCGFQLFVWLTGALAIECWYAIISLDLWFTIVMGKGMYKIGNQKTFKMLTVAYGWGFPLVCMIIAFGIGRIDSQGNLFCQYNDIAGKTDWITTFGPMIINSMISCFFLAWVFVQTYLIGRRAGKPSREVFKLLWIVIFFLVLYSFVIAFRITIGNSYNELVDGGAAWLRCILTPPNNDFAHCGAAPPSFNRDMFRGVWALSAIDGMLAWICLGDCSIPRLWIFFVSGPDRFNLTKMSNFDGRSTNASRTLKTDNMSRSGKEMAVLNSGASKAELNSRPSRLDEPEREQMQIETDPAAASSSSLGSPSHADEASP